MLGMTPILTHLQPNIVTMIWNLSPKATVCNYLPLPSLLLIDQADRENVAKAARKRASPSEDAKHFSRLATQNQDRLDAIYDQRPVGLTGPSIMIYHPIFAKFLSLVTSNFVVDKATLRNTWDFIQTSRPFYGNEYLRAGAIKKSFCSLVPSLTWRPCFSFRDGRRIEPDGAVSVDIPQYPDLVTTPICVFFEMKNEVGTGNCDPAQQCQSDFVRLYSSDDVSALPSVSCQLTDRSSGRCSGMHRVVLPFSWRLPVPESCSLVPYLPTLSSLKS